MKTSDRFNHRISTLVDTYQGAVPLARLLLEAARLESESGRPELYLQQEYGDVFLLLTFSDGSTATLAVNEEM
ncbi:MAG: hypothetical protein DMF62_03580 [Acidobacteria bacterium]|nr:MAG: hypothetical protein DMF62_03580 [Acidobacteriota bacterium]